MNDTTAALAVRMRMTLDRMLEHDSTPVLVEAFFSEEGPFAGKTFTDLPPNDAYKISTSDLLAVSLLDVAFPPRAVRWLLAPSHSGALAELLRSLPEPGRQLHELERDDLRGAEVLWSMIVEGQPPPSTPWSSDELRKAFRGVKGVKADKLLARKRPGVFPICDRTFEDLFDKRRADSDYWVATMVVLQDPERRAALQRLAPGRLLVRILDVVVWMWQSGSNNAEEARRMEENRKGLPWTDLVDAGGTRQDFAHRRRRAASEG
jgi:hypothetical protein